MYGLAAAGNERMPPFERLTSRSLGIGATLRKPINRSHIIRRERHAVWDHRVAQRIVRATRGCAVQQMTRHIRVMHRIRFRIPHFYQTALPASVAQSLPLISGKFI